MRWSIPLVALALSACGKPEEQALPGPPPEAVMNVNQPLDARGSNPTWGLTIRGLQLTLTREGQPTVVATAPGAVVHPGQASWTATLPDGRPMKVSLYSSACSDGVSEVKYGFTAEVQAPDSSPLTGCAGPPAAPPHAAKR